MKTSWKFLRIVGVLTLMALSTGAAAQSLSFVSPNGGEVYVIGQTQFVRINGRFKAVQIELSTDGGATFAPLGTLDSSKPTQNALTYTINGPSSTTCVIRATTTVGKNTLTAVSGMFSIVTEPGGSAVISNQTAIPDGAVTNPKLAPKAVTFDKVDSGQASGGMVLTADGHGNASFAPLSSTAVNNAVSFTGPLNGDVTGTQSATVVSKLQGIPLVANAPADNQVLRFNAGANRWEPGTVSTGGGGAITSIQGTPNQVNVANNGGAVTLSTPQNLATSSSPSFAGLNLNANSGSTLLNVNNAGTGLAANFSSPNPTTVTITGGDGPVLDVTGNTGDAMHALTLGQSTSGLYAEARAVDSFGVYSISFATQGHGRAVMARAYTRDGYALEAHNASTDAGGGGALLVNQDGTANNIAVFQSNKVNRAVIDNSGTGMFARLKSGNAMISSGTGSPNGAVTGNVGDLFLRTDGGAGSTLWVKESGNGTNTGWAAK